MQNKSRDVDIYIAKAPKEVQLKLKEIRSIIKGTARMSKEKISYGMPFYEYKGRLAYFAYATKHVGLYIPPPIIEQHKKDLKDYGTSKSAVRFPLDKEIPTALIKKLIKARMKWNDEKAKS